jgi:hypothetical protein
MGLNNNWDVHLGSTFSKLTESYCDRCTRGGPPLRQSRGISPWGGFNTDSRRIVSGGMWVNLWFNDEGESKGVNLSPYVNFRVSSRLQVNVGSNFTRDRNDAQWFGNFTDIDGLTHYAFAHLNQRVVSMNTRINYTMSPNLTFEFYGEPFVATGNYSNLREVSATPGAEKYADRFTPYTLPDDSPMAFRFTQLRTNSVVRWEYRPGSTLFLVWTQGRQNSEDRNPDYSWTRDYRELFGLHPNNTFLIKVAYWLNR